MRTTRSRADEPPAPEQPGRRSRQQDDIARRGQPARRRLIGVMLVVAAALDLTRYGLDMVAVRHPLVGLEYTIVSGDLRLHATAWSCQAVGPPLRGAGPIPASCRICHTVEAEDDLPVPSPDLHGRGSRTAYATVRLVTTSRRLRVRR
jgi:hypothetical protein